MLLENLTNKINDIMFSYDWRMMKYGFNIQKLIPYKYTSGMKTVVMTDNTDGEGLFLYNFTNNRNWVLWKRI